jgi:hypothetical protein
MALILGTPVRFRPSSALARGLDPAQVYRLARLYHVPGDPSYRVVLDGVPADSRPVRLSELRD